MYIQCSPKRGPTNNLHHPFQSGEAAVQFHAVEVDLEVDPVWGLRLESIAQEETEKNVETERQPVNPSAIPEALAEAGQPDALERRTARWSTETTSRLIKHGTTLIFFLFSKTRFHPVLP